MEYKGRALRHELKYIISTTEYEALKARLSATMPRDVHSGSSGYHIRSLYFDDVYSSAYSEKLSGVAFRQKYRVRIYNKSDSVIKLERKEKFNDLIAKQDIAITKDQFYALLRGGDAGFLLETGNSMAADMYRDIKTRLLAPAVTADYTREVFVFHGGNVRITFDGNLQAGINTGDIFSDEVATVNALEPGTLVLEVKYDEYLPTQIRRLLQIPAFRHEAVSKYVYCRAAQFRLNPAAQYAPPDGLFYEQ